jgi:sugar O-acyltransferase (sialic acid O-acetyltransferase NeuD family)
VAAFTVDSAYLKSDTFDGYPVVAFEDLADRFPPETHDIMLPLGYRRMNGFRQEYFEHARNMGYYPTSYVSSRASVWPDLIFGENVIIFEQVVVQSYASVGHNVMIRSGANIGHDSHLGDHSFVASGVVTGGYVNIGERCWIGLGAVLRNNIKIADRCFIGAGAVVTADTEPDGVYVGVPARRVPNKTSLDVT